MAFLYGIAIFVQLLSIASQKSDSLPSVRAILINMLIVLTLDIPERCAQSRVACVLYNRPETHIHTLACSASQSLWLKENIVLLTV